MMKKTLLLLSLSCLLLTGCGNKESWQGSYYDGGTDDTDIVRGPVFSDYEGCKARALDIKKYAYDGYVRCAKNCHDSIDGTPICEEAVRSWHPLPGFGITFDEYKG